MASLERENQTPIGVLLSQEVESAVEEWRKRRVKKSKQERRHGGERISRRERQQILDVNSQSRGKFIGQRLGAILKDQDFSILLGDFINGQLQGENPKRLEEVKKSLENLSLGQIELASEFFRIRKGYKASPDETDEKLSRFLSARIDDIPDEGFLPKFLGAISNLYPDPRTENRNR